MVWDYAMLTHAAKEAGGPGPMIESIRIAGRSVGRRDMAPLVALALGAGLGSGPYRCRRMPCGAEIVRRSTPHPMRRRQK